MQITASNAGLITCHRFWHQEQLPKIMTWFKIKIYLIISQCHAFILRIYFLPICTIVNPINKFTFTKWSDCKMLLWRWCSFYKGLKLHRPLFLIKRKKSGNGILLSKFFRLTVRKKMFERSRITFEIRGWRLRICKIFEITVTIYSNS